MLGDATLFMRADQVEAAWAVMAGAGGLGGGPAGGFPDYRAGTWGPETAENLIAQDGRSWLTPTVIQERNEEKLRDG